MWPLWELYDLLPMRFSWLSHHLLKRIKTDYNMIIQLVCLLSKTTEDNYEFCTHRKLLYVRFIRISVIYDRLKVMTPYKTIKSHLFLINKSRDTFLYGSFCITSARLPFSNKRPNMPSKLAFLLPRAIVTLLEMDAFHKFANRAFRKATNPTEHIEWNMWKITHQWTISMCFPAAQCWPPAWLSPPMSPCHWGWLCKDLAS